MVNLSNELKRKLINSVNAFFEKEYGEDAIIEELPEDGILHLAYTSYIFEGRDCEDEVQVDFNVNNLKYLNYINNTLVLEEERDNLESFIDEINSCDFNDIIRNCIDEGEKLYGEGETDYQKRLEYIIFLTDKIKNKEKLSDQEIKDVCKIIKHPLDEFCLQEGSFRLTEVLNVPVKIANKYTNEACEIISNDIDSCDELCDKFDKHLRQMLIDNGEDIEFEEE